MPSIAHQGRPDGRQSRWDQHKLERRALILDAAIELIEELGSADSFHVQQIAERAGLTRPVVYRHFTDRAELARAVQTRVLEMVRAELEPQVSLHGSIDEIILRIVETYVRWAASHPALHAMADLDIGGGSSADLNVGLREIAEQISALIQLVVVLLGVELGEDEAAALDPLCFGVVGQVFATVRSWLGRPDLNPEVEALARLLAKSVWFQIDGHARANGIVLDPTLRLDDPAAFGLVQAALRAGR